MKKYTYKDFQRGDIAMFNNNADSVKAVIEKAFPKSIVSCHGRYDFYFVRDGDWDSTMTFIPNAIHASEISLEEQVDGRKIIGYICPMDLYDGNLKKGVVVEKRINQEVTAYGENEYLIVPAEIAETWEPVYEEPHQFFPTKEELLKIIKSEVEKMPKVTIINGTHYFIEGLGFLPIKIKDYSDTTSSKT